MTSWISSLQQWWRHSDNATARLTLAVVLSVVFHLLILMVKLGEYGEGLPGFDLSLGDRRAKLPELHLKLQNPVINTAAGNAPIPIPPPAMALATSPTTSPTPEPTPANLPSAIKPATELAKAEFDLVDLPAPVPAEVPAPVARPKQHKSKPKLITAVTKKEPDFKVTSAEQAELGTLIAEEKTDEPKAMADLAPESKVDEVASAIADLEKLAQEKAEQDRLAFEKLALAKAEQAKSEQMQAEAKLKEQLAKQHEQELLQAQRQAEALAVQQKQQEKQQQEKQQQELRARQQAELEQQRLAQLAAQRAADELAEKLKQEELAKQRAKDAAQKLKQEQLAQLEKEKLQEQEKQKAREKEQQALAIRAAQEAEQRRLAETARIEKERADQLQLEKLKAEQQKEQLQKEQQQRELQQREQQRQQQIAEQLKREQLERELVEKNLAEKNLAKKNRLEQEQRIRQAQLAEQLAAQAKAQRESELRQAAQRAAEQAQADERARAQAQAQANARQQGNGIDDLMGAGSASQGANSGNAKPDMDKLLSGRSFDFDKNGESLKSASSANLPTPKAPLANNARRSIFGSKNIDVGLNLYIQSWRQKVERNGRLNYSQSAKDHMYTDPIVTVSVRSDGSVESVTILRSSGRPEMDEAVRRIALVNAPYSAFPPSLARKYDVIDIRQIWVFDDALHIVDEMR